MQKAKSFGLSAQGLYYYIPFLIASSIVFIFS